MLWDRISGDNIDIIALLEDIDIIEEAAAAAAAEDINVCPVTQHTLHSLSDLSHPTWPGPDASVIISHYHGSDIKAR